MNKLLSIILTLLTLDTYCQDTVFIRQSDPYADSILYKTDTVIFLSAAKSKILYGTTILPWTDNQQVAKSYGLFFNNIKFSECQENIEQITEDEEYLDQTNSILTVTKNDTLLTVEIKIIANCCHSFLCDISVENDSILNLIYYGYGVSCSCDCCYGLIYQIKNERYFEDNKKIKYVMIKDDKKTIKKINEL